MHNNTVYIGSSLYKHFKVPVTLDRLEEKNTIIVYQSKSQETQITPLNLGITDKVHRTACLWVITQHNNPAEHSSQPLCGGSLKSRAKYTDAACHNYVLFVSSVCQPTWPSAGEQ